MLLIYGTMLSFNASLTKLNKWIVKNMIIDTLTCSQLQLIIINMLNLGLYFRVAKHINIQLFKYEVYIIGCIQTGR